ncbi:hypothetical protein BBJ28_00002902 [Nothophytophthora sp. Chile5]|nr:hypothetical protein BBJ28_00002902 [Nothophytophthora sp. Chile5]
MPAATPPGSRPHTFGRSSNVWQYLELVSELKTPLVDGQSPFGLSGLTDEGDSEDDDLMSSESDGGDDDDEIGSELGGKMEGGARIRHREDQTTRRRGSEATTAAAGSSTAGRRRSGGRKASSSLMKSVVSLPNLQPPSRRQGSKKELTIATTSSTLTSATAGRSAVGGRPSFNSVEIMKRLHALGSSASAPLLAASPFGTGGNTIDNPALFTGAQGQEKAAANQAAAASGSTATTPLTLPSPSTGTASSSAAAGAMAVAPAPLSDAEKLRNDFNSQATRLSYGCSVALELFNGHLMMVGSPDGLVRVQALEKLQLPQTKGYRDRAIFTLLDLADVRSAGSLRYGDSVWLQLSVGPGDVSWEQGGVLGAKVREAPQLKALGLLDDDAIRNDVPSPAVVGCPVPITAYLPKVDEIQSRVRNKAAKMLGKWVIRSAVCQRRKQKDCLGQTFVYNNDEIYLEQDWFYLGADSDAGLAVLRQLPPVSALKDVKPGEYVVERRAAWKLRLLDSSSGGAGLSLAQQQMERLLLRAKTQLKQSQRMRAGQTKSYGPSLQSGSGFTTQLRAQVAASTRHTESRYVERQERRLKRIDQHLSEKAQGMRVDLSVQEEAAGGGEKLEDTGRVEGQEGLPPRVKAKASSRRTPLSIARSGVASRERLATASDRRESLRGLEGEKVADAKSQSAAAAPDSGDPPAAEASCALCHSSSIGYNLCCQFRSVMDLLQHERVVATRESMKQQHNSTPQSAATGGNGASAAKKPTRSRAGHSSGSDDVSGTAASSQVPPAAERRLSSRTSATEATMVAMEAGVSPPSIGGSGGPTAVSGSRQPPPPNARVLELFAREDAAMMGLIRYKEKEAHRALAAETQARIGISPAAAHFRDRFKHVGLFMLKHQHQPQQPPEQQQDGISGHFQRLHAALLTISSRRSVGGKRRKKRDVDGEEGDSEDDDLDSEDGDSDDNRAEAEPSQPQLDMRTCPLQYPGEGFDVFGNPLEDSDAAVPERMFPTQRELELLPPVDTKAALALYLQNRAAMAEMLNGYAELVDTQMAPALRAALAARNRGVLVETLDFVARASEFVCARRVQVFVAQLLHAVAASDVGDFAHFQREFDELLAEMQGTSSFIRFVRDTKTARPKKR